MAGSRRSRRAAVDMTSETRNLYLEHRIERLELSCRRSRRFAATAALALAVVATGAWTGHLEPVDELVARKITLIDAEGVVRGEWTCSAQDEPMLRMRNDAGVQRIGIGVKRDTALVLLTDLEGRSRLALSTDAGGNPQGLWFDHAERPRIHLTVAGAGGDPNLRLTDARGLTPVGMGLMPDGTPWLRPSRDHQGGTWGRPTEGGETRDARD